MLFGILYSFRAFGAAEFCRLAPCSTEEYWLAVENIL
jgi:hypothetical protein